MEREAERAKGLISEERQKKILRILKFCCLRLWSLTALGNGFAGSLPPVPGPLILLVTKVPTNDLPLYQAPYCNSGR
jgi:hypothetical protein